MTDRETWQVAAFAAPLGAVESGVVTGNAREGQIFSGRRATARGATWLQAAAVAWVLS